MKQFLDFFQQCMCPFWSIYTSILATRETEQCPFGLCSLLTQQWRGRFQDQHTLRKSFSTLILTLSSILILFNEYDIYHNLIPLLEINSTSIKNDVHINATHKPLVSTSTVSWT